MERTERDLAMTRRSLALLLSAATVGVASYAAAALLTVNTVAPDAPTRPPQFEVDAAWPRPLPNRWLMGQAAGVAVDRQDHIWVVQRPRTLTEDEKGATLTPPRNECCAPAPSVMEFDLEATSFRPGVAPTRA